MYMISTYPFMGTELISYSEKLIKNGSASDIGFELFYDHLPFYNAAQYRQFMPYFSAHKKLGMHCPINGCCLLAPYGTSKYRDTINKHRECFDLAAKLGSEYVVVHTNSTEPAYAADIDRGRKLLAERMDLIADIACEYGITVAVENVGLRYNNSLYADENDFIRLADNKKYKILIDIGHANCNGWDIPQLIRIIGHRTVGFHFHDNDGMSDSHIPVFAGTSDWDNILKAIKQYAPYADRTIEYGKEYTDKIPAGIEKLKEGLDL